MGEIHSRISSTAQPLTIIRAGRPKLLCRLRHWWRPANRLGIIECRRCEARAVRA